MLKVGLTGGVACGKSTIGQMLVARGAHLVRADDIAHQLMQPGQAVYEKVRQHFGPSIVHQDGSIDRLKLAEAAFGAGRVEELNRIVHPAVIDYQNRWMKETGGREPNAVVIVEAALILEAGVEGRFDRLIVVTCRAEQKAERFAVRQKLPLDAARVEVERRSAAQVPDEEKTRAADYVIDNSGNIAAAEQQVDALWPELQQLAKQQSRS
ncbi:MAG TPA: dephospho-CoA kinase [Terriglobales bacterium]